MSSSPNIEVVSSPERESNSPPPLASIHRYCSPNNTAASATTATATSKRSTASPKDVRTTSSSTSYTSFSISSILSRGEPTHKKAMTQHDNPLDVSQLAAAAALHPCATDPAMLSRLVRLVPLNQMFCGSIYQKKKHV